MPVSVTPAVERIARVIAGFSLSRNAEGTDPHAASAVDVEWRDHVDEALAILATLREPDAEMAAAGDVDNWKAMIATALGYPHEPRLEAKSSRLSAS